MTTSDKLNYLLETKEAIKTSIQNKGVEVADTDTFRSYAEKIDSIESGADLNEYFNTNPETFESSSSKPFMFDNYFKKLPNLVIPDNVRVVSYLFSGSSSTTNYILNVAPKIIFNNNVESLSSAFSNAINVETMDLSSCNVENVYNMGNAFSGNQALKSIDLSTWHPLNLTQAKSMFYNCKKLMFIDMRNFDFTKLTLYTEMFGSSNYGVPDNCEIIVKDDEQKTWVTEKFTRLTNVKTVAEYEAQ